MSVCRDSELSRRIGWQGGWGRGGQEYLTSKALYSRKCNFSVPSITPPPGSLHPTLLCPYHQRMLVTGGSWWVLSTCPGSASSVKNSKSLKVRLCVLSMFQCPFSQLLYLSPGQHVHPHFLSWPGGAFLQTEWDPTPSGNSLLS